MAGEAKDKMAAAEGIGEGDQGEETPKKKRGKFKLFLLLGVIIVAVAAGGTAGYLFFGKQIAAYHFMQGREKKKETIGPILSLEPFIFNVGGDSPRYAKIALGVDQGYRLAGVVEAGDDGIGRSQVNPHGGNRFRVFLGGGHGVSGTD